MTRVTLYTRRDCRLCDEAKEAIRKSGVDVEISEVDVDTRRDLVARYGADVPVIFIDGVERFRHRVDAQAFADAVRTSLSNEKCVPCRGGVPALKGEELDAIARQLGGGWRIVDEHHLEKEYRFPDFAQALAFTNEVGAIAEEEQHHPDIYVAWGKVRITIWTHAVDGLTR